MKFFKLGVGDVFLSNKFSDPGRLVEYEKIGDELTEENEYLQVIVKITHCGNARRKTYDMLFKFSPEDEVLPCD